STWTETLHNPPPKFEEERTVDKKEYVKKYKRIYKGITTNNQKKAQELIDKLADVLVMMDECKDHIDEEGCVTEMSQGNYSIERENPWSKVYDAKAKLMIQIIEKLDKMLPDQKADAVSKAGENLVKLVANGKPIELR
ncbi:MAG: hypothetical protein KBT03_12740, partial [Bacteroidales bacterium]|nr:hypothetical protein [Candidatus Scybalousia scybalohippi]